MGLCPFSRVQNLLNQKVPPSPQITCAPGYMGLFPPQILEHRPLHPARLELDPRSTAVCGLRSLTGHVVWACNL